MHGALVSEASIISDDVIDASDAAISNTSSISCASSPRGTASSLPRSRELWDPRTHLKMGAQLNLQRTYRSA